MTSLAALGLIADAINAVNDRSCSREDKEQRMMMQRVRILGRLAVMQKLSNLEDGHAAIEAAILLAHAARTRTTYFFGFVAAHDFSFEDVTCDLARDLVAIGNVQSGRELIEAVQQTPPYFIAGCLGRLAGALDRLGKAEDAQVFRREALDRARAIKDPGEHQIGLGTIASGWLAAGHLTEALQMLRGIDPEESSSSVSTGAVRLGYYRSLAMQEAVSGRYEDGWRIAEAAWKDTGFPPWTDLAELLRALSAAGFPGQIRTVIGQAQALLDGQPADKVSPVFRAALGSALILAGKLDEGRAQLALVAKAAEAAKPTAVANLQDYYWESLVRAYAEIGDTEHAIDLLDRVFPADSNASPRRIARWGALRDVALALTRQGSPTEAVHIAELAHDPELRALVIRANAIKAANEGQYAEAEHWARVMPSEREVRAVLADIAARGALALPGPAHWVVVLREEEQRRTFPGTFSSAFDP